MLIIIFDFYIVLIKMSYVLFYVKLKDSNFDRFTLKYFIRLFINSQL